MLARISQNPSTQIEPELTYDITIPLEPFDSGLDHVSQPEATSFRLQYLKLPVRDWRSLDRRSFQIERDDQDCSIYIGVVHNPVEIESIKFTHFGGLRFRIDCVLLCCFEFEGVADNEIVRLSVEVEFQGLESALESKRSGDLDIAKAGQIASTKGKREARRYLKEMDRKHRKIEAIQVASRLADLTGYAEPIWERGKLLFPRLPRVPLEAWTIESNDKMV